MSVSVSLCVCVIYRSQLEADSGRQQTELEELQQRVTSLQTEKNSLLLDKTNLTADIKSLEADLEVSRHANRYSDPDLTPDP